MSGTCAIVPVKAFYKAKSRLQSVLTGSQRATIARLMAVDVLSALRAVPEVDRVLVVCQGKEQAALAREHKCEYLIDDPRLDVSANVERAARLPSIASASTLLVIPADLPLLRPADIRALLAGDEGGMTICRALRDGGTNAMMVSPPDNVTFSFGSNSAQRHAAAARLLELRVRIIDHAAFQRDIDVPADLLWVSRYGQSGETVNYLQRSKVTARLVQLMPESMAS
jgi:2-phospho-L-lactate/phosphoenolpyruvate guanylyltransferase